MNKRQYKKAFKKKYGFTPKQYSIIATSVYNIDWQNVIDNVEKALNEYVNAANIALNNMRKVLKDIVINNNNIS